MGVTPLRSRIARVLAEREYTNELIRFALPIALQSLVTSSLNMTSVVMIGQLGETPLAAVGLANQIFFLLQLILFGINSGAAMFTAQFWGKQDLPNIRKVLSLGLILGLSAASFFLALATLKPGLVLGVYSKDPAVISLGSEYLRVFGWSFVFMAISFSFAVVLRSTGQVRTPMLVSTVALAFNTLLAYLLIFGKLGLPELGVRGAAIAGLSGRILECSVLLGIVYLRRMPIALRLRDFSNLSLDFIRSIMKPILPVMLNETFWSFGITAYNAVYARISTDSIAAMNIVSTIENLAFVVVFGIGHATAIMVGNRIGSGKEEQAYEYAKRSLVLAMISGALIGSQVLLWSPFILSLYKVDPLVIEYASRALKIFSLLLWIRAANMVIIVGILRSGGDTRFSFLLDGMIIWVVGVPAAILTAFILKLPVYWVYLAIMSEEILKCGIGMWRIFSRKWIHNLTQTV